MSLNPVKVISYIIEVEKKEPMLYMTWISESTTRGLGLGLGLG